MSKEAMKLALDALEASKGLVGSAHRNMALQGNAAAMACLPQLEAAEKGHIEAIAALREALAQPQQDAAGVVTTDCQEGPALIEAYQPIKAGETLYTSPQARKPLTDYQWHGVAMQAREAFFGCKQDNVLGQINCAAHAAMRATEATHGIKETP